MTDIVLTCWKREWMTKSCLMALKRNTQTPYRLIIIDNGSDLEFQATWLAPNANVYVKLDKNYGLEYAKNLGMQFVESELFVSMDNDILVYSYRDKDWLSQLIELMDKYPSFGAIAPRPQVLVATGMQMFETQEEVISFGHVPGYARIMRTKLVKSVGAWSDKRPLRGHEEMWIGEKFNHYGWKMGWANFIHCWHLFGTERTDMWGYENMKPEESGHNPVWPIYTNDAKEILDKVGVDING